MSRYSEFQQKNDQSELSQSDLLFSAYLLYRRRLPFGRLSNRNNEKSEYMVALQY